jgi:hypothetical protein
VPLATPRHAAGGADGAAFHERGDDLGAALSIQLVYTSTMLERVCFRQALYSYERIPLQRIPLQRIPCLGYSPGGWPEQTKGGANGG